MEVIVSGRHMEIDQPVREFAEEKIQKLGHEYAKLTVGHIVLSEERGRVIVDGHVNGKHIALNARAKASDSRAAIDGVYEKLERQLRKHLERVQSHRAPSLAEVESGELADVEAPDDLEEDEALEEDEDIESEFGI